MIREDYLLRLIQQLGEFFRRTLGSVSANSSEELDQHLEQLAGEILGLPYTLIMALPPEELISLFEMSDRMVIEKCFVTAEIHRLRAQVEKDTELQKLFRERAVFFFETVTPDLHGELGEQAREHLNELASE
ncbi:MAG: hypothetical protein O7C75_01845 [Verrucomicrobia bacterium]|nr:hypothetical protein [Verrucomicrobiota bacterium]